MRIGRGKRGQGRVDEGKEGQMRAGTSEMKPGKKWVKGVMDREREAWMDGRKVCM